MRDPSACCGVNLPAFKNKNLRDPGPQAFGFLTSGRILPLFSKQLHNLFQHVPLVWNRCSAYCSSLPWVFIYFFHYQDWFASVFSSVLCLISFHHCVIVFSLFMFIHFPFVHHSLSSWHCLYMVFIVNSSSILIICNLFTFHHISYL